jgi:alpha-galactosidase
MTNTEYVSYFSLWAITKAPLLIGGEVTNMSQATLDIYLNREAIAINQDPLGVQGKRINSTPQGTEVWAGPLADGSQAVLLLNRNSPGSEMITVKWTDLGWSADEKAQVRDLWAHQDVGTFTTNYTSPNIERHAVQMLKITPIH